jgi:hypothetical protein
MMKLLRRVLAILLVFSLGATPVAARLAEKSHAPEAVAYLVKSASMSDCHGMAIETSTKKSGQKNCPGCAKDKPCSAGSCDLQCFKIVAALPETPHLAAQPSLKFARLFPLAVAPFVMAPQPPPPRA